MTTYTKKYVKALDVPVNDSTGALLVDAQLAVQSIEIGTVGVLDSAEARINPATKENQTAANGYLSTIATNSGTASTAANQATANAYAKRVAGVMAATAVTKNTWTALPSAAPRVAKVCAVSATSGNTSTVTVWESPDGGTNYYQVMRADNGTKASAVSVSVGTGKPSAGSNYCDTFLIVLRNDTTHVMVQETAVGTDNFAYSVVGV